MSLKDRRDEMESRYAHDQEKKFKLESRRNRLFGNWAAGKLGKSGEEVDAYVQEVVKASFAKAGDDDILDKVRNDFAGAGIETSGDEIERQLEAALVEADAQMAKD